ncbi:glycosyltransferase [Methylobacterium sp. Leaf466]|uniref:glycosyltransferase n=1 Tax=Methylobacterium sp. Leaf466 TaxID=1736386 RepID=UPI000B3323BE|nr:glycosyltransferase [Methylobacterium sp. Leaf466]
MTTVLTEPVRRHAHADTRPMRLLSVNNYHYRRGGAEVVFLEHNRLMRETGWDVTSFAMKHPKNLPSASDASFVDEIEFGQDYGVLRSLRQAATLIYSFEARAKLRPLIAAQRPDVAHVHNIYHHISPSFLPLLRQAGIPVVMTLHDLKIACPAYTMLSQGKVCERCRGGRIYNVAVRRCVKNSVALSGLVMVETLIHRMLDIYDRNVDRFVVPSRFYIDKLVEWGWPRERFVHIPNFVDVDDFTPSHLPGEGFLYVGRLSPEKGLDTLIRAAAKAGQRVALVGSGAMEPHLRSLAAETGGDVHFLGYLTGEGLHDAIRSSRAVVLASTWYENGPISLMEAYALGRPVIGTRIGGIPEMIREDVTGLIVPPNDADALAAAMTRLAAMPAERAAAISRAARTLVEDEFSVERYRSRILSLYADIARGPT